ncbi:MAG: sulfatase-like hydrolase/transferase [Deltaproteobacteria bacterium]|nr:MAG: sulfatase-like hydrolase/transferase [Deltaproteobacteria bacterium]
MSGFGVAAGRRLGGAFGRGLAVALVAALPALLDLALRFPAYRARIAYLYYVSGPLKIAALYVLVLAASALLYGALLAVPRVGRWLTAALVATLFTAQMAYRSAMGGFAGVREVAILAASEAGMTLDAVTSFFSFEMLLWAALAVLLAATLVRIARSAVPTTSLARAAALVALALFAHGALWNYLYRKCQAFPADPVLHSVRALVYFDKERREFLSIPRERLAPDVAAGRPDDNVVLILDESVRYGFLSINDPEVGTTPFLLELARRHPGFRDYGLMLAGSTCSMSSEAMILTGTTRAPDSERRALRNPTLFQHAKRMGYRTVLLDAWGTAFPNNFLRDTDLRFVDEHLGGAALGGPEAHPDLGAADWARRRITSSRGNFVFILKQGAHFHYERAYPSHDPSYRRFVPTLGLDESYAASRQRMINSYKNAIAFSVDAFARRLLPDDLNHTTILWASDHGQSLQEHGQTYTHCNREIEQALVPFFTLSDSPWTLAHQPRAARDASIFYSHHNVYPTVVSLLRKDRAFAHEGFQSLYAAEPEQPPLYYLYGGLWGGSTVIPVSGAQLAAFRADPRRGAPGE